jgi:hypothetical protein
VSFGRAPYVEGVQAALDSFGIRTASDLMDRRMPDGPEHLGAEWLARQLSQQDDKRARVGTQMSYRPLEKPPLWGPRASLEGTGAAGHDYSGMTPYGGV